MTRMARGGWWGTAALAFALAGCGSSAPQFDLIVRGGQVLDGQGTPARRADIGVSGDRIVAIGDLQAATASAIIDASGKVVSPGFIDVQGQSGTTLLIDGRGESHLRQGITSEIIGEGDSPAFWTAKTASGEALARAGKSVDWTGYDQYFKRLTGGGIAVNLGTLVPATLVRSEIIGLDNRAPTPEELQRMTGLVEQAMQDGAFGLSSALIYMPGSFASTEELVGAGDGGGPAPRHLRHAHPRRELQSLQRARRGVAHRSRGQSAGGRLPPEGRRAANWGRMGEAVTKLSSAAASRAEGLGDDVSVRGGRHPAGGRAAAVGAGGRQRRDAGSAWPTRRSAPACARRSRGRPRAGRTC